MFAAPWSLAMNSPAHEPSWRARLAGALAMSVFFLLFWITAAADELPPRTPEFIRSLTPARGLINLAAGLFCSALAGGLIVVALTALFRAAAGLLHRHGDGATPS
jgi:hypothetical protein